MTSCIILQLEGTIASNMKEQGTEIEALKYSINSQQVGLDKLKEQLIKKQMLMDAKECQLIEMEEQLKKENQKHITEVNFFFSCLRSICGFFLGTIISRLYSKQFPEFYTHLISKIISSINTGVWVKIHRATSKTVNV